MKKSTISRRRFVTSSVKGAMSVAFMQAVISSCSGRKGPNERIALGHIGVGDRGTAELLSYLLPLPDALNVAVCDTFRDRRENAAMKVNQFYKENDSLEDVCKAYPDMDELLERSDIDAVHITTPDHWHVLAAIKAVRAGKHVMVAKPLGLSYPEYTVLAKELKDRNLKFHYGTQQRSFEHMKLVYDLIREGAIGEVGKVDVWCPGKNDVPIPVCNEVPVPPDFDFDKWTGPAPMRPYCPDRVTNNSSWFNYDYSIGFLGGWGAHPLDILVWVLKEQVNGIYTTEGKGEYWAAGGLYNNILSWDVNCIYQNGLEVHFVSDDVALKGMLGYRTMKETNGTTFFGTKGWISVSRSSVQSNIPELDLKLNNFPKNNEGWIRSENNTMGNRFLSVIRGDEKELCPLEDAIISDTISHMGDIAIRCARKVTWDPVKGEITGDPDANKLYIRDMRSPYTI